MINEKTNWHWQLSQFSQRIGEWLEYQISQWNVSVPKLSLPQWSEIPWLQTLLETLLWLLVALFTFWMARELWRQFGPYWYSWLANRAGKTTQEQKTKPLSTADLWERSQEFSRQNNYGEACRYLYLAMLQRLHDQQIVPHKSSRTDGEYLQLVQLSKVSQPYETLITTHEQLCFGHKSISQINYEQCQQAYQEISQQ